MKRARLSSLEQAPRLPLGASGSRSTIPAARRPPAFPSHPALPVLTPASLSPIDSLADALLAERRLLDELSEVVRRQRTAMDDDDMDAMSDCVFATHRMLVTLQEARTHRRSIGTMIGLPAGAEANADSLERALGARMTPALRAARDELHASAKLLAREVARSRGRVAST